MSAQNASRQNIDKDKITYVVSDTKPKAASDNDRSKVRRKVGVDRSFSELSHLFFKSKDPSGRKGLKEADEKHDKVDVKVNDVQKVETRIRTVDDAKQEANEAHHCRKGRLAVFTQVDGIRSGGERTFQQPETRIDSKKKEVKEQETHPVNSSWKSTHDNGPSSKDKRESSKRQVLDCNSFDVGKVAKRSKDSKATNEGEHGVGAGNDEGVENSGFVSLVVGTKGCHDSKL